MSYRVVEKNGQFEPQMEMERDSATFWTPLKADGYWANPESYSFGNVTKVSLMTEQEAIRAVALAKEINGESKLRVT